MINGHILSWKCYSREITFCAKTTRAEMVIDIAFYIVFIVFRTAQIKYDAFITSALFVEFQT